MTDDLLLPRYLQRWPASPFGAVADAPWRATGQAEALIRSAIPGLGPDYVVRAGVAVHESATIETGAVLKGAAIVGPRCFIAAGAYLRGGVYLEGECIVGPGAELKSSFMLKGSRLAHLNFVGDSILGADVNLEAGAIIANYRNELQAKALRIRHEERIIDTGVEKFGALVGDGARIGANAVIAPGAIIPPGATVGRLQHVDQSPESGGQG